MMQKRPRAGRGQGPPQNQNHARRLQVEANMGTQLRHSLTIPRRERERENDQRKTAAGNITAVWRVERASEKNRPETHSHAAKLAAMPKIIQQKETTSV
jgi:hypothetical protein